VRGPMVRTWLDESNAVVKAHDFRRRRCDGREGEIGAQPVVVRHLRLVHQVPGYDAGVVALSHRSQPTQVIEFGGL
jgi:hypothetical protein